MELSVQDWLIVIGALLIMGVLLDAYRRYRNESRGTIRVSRRTKLMGGSLARDESDPVSAELPSGSARVRDRDRDRDYNPDPVPQTPAQPPPRREPRVEPQFEAPPAAEQQQGSLGLEQPFMTATREASPAASGDQAGSEVLVIHVLARDAGGFSGDALLKIFQACDVRHGSMNIFHRHEEEKGQGPVQFSISNVTEPGTFDIDNMAGLHARGLSFFMRLPGPQRPLEAFDCMLETARVVAKNLDGEMRDQSHSVFTPQTVEHCRQRIRDFSHRVTRQRR
jgi:cell division protein ZipA